MSTTSLKISFVLLIVSCSFILKSQTYFGYKGGVNFANVSTTEDGAITNGRIIGAHIGLYFDFEVKNIIAIQPELNFIQRGFRRNFSTDALYRLNYFDLAVLIKYKFKNLTKSKKKRKKINGYIVIGPFIEKTWSGKVKNLKTGKKRDYDFSKGAGLVKAQEDLGLVFGGGIGKKIGRGEVILDFRYTIGFVDINDNYLLEGDINNQGIICSLGYIFKI